MSDAKPHAILVPVDFSAHAVAAMALAGEVANAFGSVIHVAHVYPDATALRPDQGPSISEEFGVEIERAAVDYFRAWQVHNCPPDIPIEEHIRRGDASNEIIALAAEIGADLIVLGTRGLTGLRHIVMGSVAERVVRGAGCPVLTTRSTASAES